MRRYALFILCLTAACGLLPRASATPTAEPTPLATATRPAPTAAPSNTVLAAPTATRTAVPLQPTFTPTPTAEARRRPAGSGDIIFHPDPRLYSGDIVSLEVLAPADRRPGTARPSKCTWIQAAGAAGTEQLRPLRAGQPAAGDLHLGMGHTAAGWGRSAWSWRSPRRRQRARPPGADAGGEVDLLPAERAARARSPRPQWAQAESDCCIFHYLTHTAAARDIDAICAQARRGLCPHSRRCWACTPPQKVVFTLASKLIGHGGFASGEISLSYLDRNPAASDLFTLFSHEGTHVLDRQISTHAADDHD